MCHSPARTEVRWPSGSSGLAKWAFRTAESRTRTTDQECRSVTRTTSRLSSLRPRRDFLSGVPARGTWYPTLLARYGLGTELRRPEVPTAYLGALTGAKAVPR